MSRKIKGSWIVAHADSLGPITSTPPQFHIWAAISAIGAVLKNNIYIKYSTFKIYPNQYIVFAAPPGVGKGTAIHAVWDYVKELDLVHVIADRVTAPKILDKMMQGRPGTVNTNSLGVVSMQKDCSSTLFSTELATLLGASDWMLTFLCEVWDRSEFAYETKNSGSYIVKNLCTSLVGGCTPNYIRRINKDVMAAISGGFTARTIFVYADGISKSIPWPKPLDSTAKGVQLIADLKHDLVEIAQLQGEVTFHPAAAQCFTRFFPQLSPLEDDTDVILHFKSRMHVHIFKTAMIFMASRKNGLVIEEEDMINAVICLQGILQNLNKAFRGVGESDLAEATSLVQGVIEKKGFTTKNEIMAIVHRQVNPEDLNRILHLLESIKFCRSVNRGGVWIYEHTDQTKVANITPGSLII